MAQCTAKSKQSGQQCRASAVPGTRVCKTHGGSAPQVKAAGRLRLAILADPAIGVFEHAISQKGTKLREALIAAKEVLDRNPEFAAVHRYENLTPAEAMTSDERKARLKALHAELFGPRETVQ